MRLDDELKCYGKNFGMDNISICSVRFRKWWVVVILGPQKIYLLEDNPSIKLYY